MKARTKTYIMYSITTFSGDAEVIEIVEGGGVDAKL